MKCSQLQITKMANLRNFETRYLSEDYCPKFLPVELKRPYMNNSLNLVNRQILRWSTLWQMELRILYYNRNMASLRNNEHATGLTWSPVLRYGHLVMLWATWWLLLATVACWYLLLQLSANRACGRKYWQTVFPLMIWLFQLLFLSSALAC